MPLQFLLAYLHFLPIGGNGGKLSFVELYGEVVAEVRVGEDGVAAIGLVDGFKQGPSANESFAIDISWRVGGWCEIIG